MAIFRRSALCKALHKADHLSITVRDDGKGISTDRLGRIFDPFFTTRMGSGGTGLGLHVVHGIVTNVLGGTISVNSTVGAGAEFVMTLPRHAPVKASAEKTTG